MRTVAVIGLVAVLGLWVYAQPPVDFSPKEVVAPFIATCDPQKVIDSYEKVKVGLEALNEKTTAAKQELQAKANQVQAKQDENAALRLFLDAKNKEFATERETLVKASLAEMNAAIAKVANDKGVNLVLAKRAETDVGDTILYSSSDLDITEAVIKELNDGSKQ